MSSSIKLTNVTYYELHCCNCGREQRYNAQLELATAQRVFRNEGWQMVDTRAYCPVCCKSHYKYLAVFIHPGSLAQFELFRIIGQAESWLVQLAEEDGIELGGYDTDAKFYDLQERIGVAAYICRVAMDGKVSTHDGGERE